MVPVFSWILASTSKFRPCQFSGYTPWMLPMPAASMSTPRSAIILHSSGSATSPPPTTPSSSPPMAPTSASTEMPFSPAMRMISLVFSMFSSMG